MFRLIDWVLDRIAPIGLTGEPGADSDLDWQRPIVESLTEDHNRRILGLGADEENTRPGSAPTPGRSVTARRLHDG